ncbi:MAG: hypothetical protein DRO88_02110 [Promethearchaeia archaeon]|nr:MAG: hypothetical protein DRO88_02110 [Candidatus Lokiarchaeia archaeon]
MDIFHKVFITLKIRIYMVGGSRKPQTKIFRDFEIETPSGDVKTLKEIVICCPICHSSHVGNHGTRKRGNTQVQIYQCKNPNCAFLKHANQGKQFTIYSSLMVKSIVNHYLHEILAK